MANDTPPKGETPTKPAKGGAWTDEEKARFFFQLIFQMPKIDWKKITLPPGRDERSCQNMIASEKRRLGLSTKAAHKADAAGESDGVHTPQTGAIVTTTTSPFSAGGGESSGVATPTPSKKKAATPRKRKNAAAAAAETDGGDNHHNNEGDDEKPAPKRKRAPAKKKVIKAEAEDDAGHKLPEIESAKPKEFGGGGEMNVLGAPSPTGGYEAGEA